MLCDFGCGKDAFFILKNDKNCCSSSPNKCECIKKKNSEGVARQHKLGNGGKFTDEDRLKSRQAVLNKVVPYWFVKDSMISNGAIKKALLEFFHVEEKCSICGIEVWNNLKLMFELDHINGESTDNRVENLRLLCPNCHSQTNNFRGRNINNGKEKVPEDAFVLALKSSKNIRRALLKLKLSPKGANYEKARFLIEKYSIVMEEVI